MKGNEHAGNKQIKVYIGKKKAISCSFVIDKQHLFRFRRNGFHAQLRFTCLLFLQGLIYKELISSSHV